MLDQHFIRDRGPLQYNEYCRPPMLGKPSSSHFDRIGEFSSPLNRTAPSFEYEDKVAAAFP